MKRYIITILAFLLAISVPLHAQYAFTIEKSVKCTEVQDQQMTNTCWSFATNSFLESELIRSGYSGKVNLSEMYNVRRIYLDKAQNYLLRQGKANFAEGGLSHDVIRAYSAYGAIPESVYPGRTNETGVHNHTELIVVLKSILDGMLAKNVVSEKWPEIVNAILDIYLGPVPETFNVGAQSYSPESFAHSLKLDPNDYVSITSFTHHPYYEKFVLEIPDNHANGMYYNVTLDDLTRIANNALVQGYSVAWDGDVSEPSYSAQYGLAVLPEQTRNDVFAKAGPEAKHTAADRQKMFETYSTTDDHLMHITGLARDQNGRQYYVVKNSWGLIGPFEGFLYMSEAYFRSKTIAIMVHRDAIPMDIAAKLNM